MTPQEMQALDTFLSQLTQARAEAKDPQAEARIVEAVARQPDAAYLLVQRAMLLDQALASAKAKIAALQNQLQAAQASGPGTFLSPDNAWGNHASRVAPNAGLPSPMAASMPVPQAPQPAPVQAPRPGFLSGGLGSTLGSIATTAAGVAGGAFLFQGIENLFHHNSGNGFLGQSAMQPPPTETVINNYYEGDCRASAADDSVLDTDFSNDGFVDDDSTMI